MTDARRRPDEDPRPPGDPSSPGGAHPRHGEGLSSPGARDPRIGSADAQPGGAHSQPGGAHPQPGGAHPQPGEEGRELPVDADLVEPRSLRPPRGVHLRPALILLVALGGALGTGLREAISLAVPVAGGFPLAIFGINLVGAFVLGFLLEALSRRGPDTGRRRLLRLGLGTGVLGGFTTYSALAADSAVLLTGPEAWLGVVYALATVVLGAGATLAGIALASPRRPRTGAA